MFSTGPDQKNEANLYQMKSQLTEVACWYRAASLAAQTSKLTLQPSGNFADKGIWELFRTTGGSVAEISPAVRNGPSFYFSDFLATPLGIEATRTEVTERFLKNIMDHVPVYYRRRLVSLPEVVPFTPILLCFSALLDKYVQLCHSTLK